MARLQTIKPLSPAELRWRCDPKSLPFTSTEEIEPVQGVIGQDNAIESLRFGLQIHAPGQNIFARGLTGTGRMTLVSRLLDEIRLECPLGSDRCYVHNFEQTDRPRLITLNRGQGHEFRRAMDELAQFIREKLDVALASEAIQSRVSALEQEAQRQIDSVVEPLEKELRKVNISMVTLQVDPVTQAALFPLVNGKPTAPEEWEQLRSGGEVTDEQAEAFRKHHDAYQQQLRAVMRDVNTIRRNHTTHVRSVREEAAKSILGELVLSIEERFPSKPVKVFLKEVIADAAGERVHEAEHEEDYTRLYRVNVVLSRADDTSCPIVLENTPTLGNLLGTIDQRFESGESVQSDHLMVRAGSLLRADGGYLILEAREILREPAAWKVLVRTLRTGRLEIMPAEMTFPGWGSALKPEPIEMNVKVVLLGSAETYYMLDEYDPDFPHLFKVLADFESEMPRTSEGVAQYSRVIARIAKEENLPHFSNSAVAALAEHGARIASRNDKLTTRFGRLADVAREAAFICKKKNAAIVEGIDVKSAIKKSKERANLPSKRFRELLADGLIRVETNGATVGQINGLAVIHAGPLTYGFPTRITSAIGPGSAGVVNIEREAELSGAIHTKGFYILGGLLRRLLKTNHPLAFHASIAFEQSYGGIDGDSASGAESCCMLSVLTNIPLRQDIAMTGAIDQVGATLPVGAINEKIEGFFDVCNDAGLTGDQGVIIPRANARDLMLRDDVLAACEDGSFRVYAVDRLHDALEILMGIPAGECNDEGEYPPDTILGIAKQRAYEYWLKTKPNDRTARGKLAAKATASATKTPKPASRKTKKKAKK